MTLIKGDWVRLEFDVLDGCTRVDEGTEGEVLDPPDADGFFTLKDGPRRYRVPVDAVVESRRLIPEELLEFL